MPTARRWPAAHGPRWTTPNPRADNVWGHVLRWNETGGDPTALTFAWDIFVLAGNPQAVTGPQQPAFRLPRTSPPPTCSTAPTACNSTRRAGCGSRRTATIPMPATSPAWATTRCWSPTSPAGEIRRFLVGPSACEITGVTWTPDRKTMFFNVQHPGEVDGGHPNTPKKANGSTYTLNDIAREAQQVLEVPGGGRCDGGGQLAAAARVHDRRAQDGRGNHRLLSRSGRSTGPASASRRAFSHPAPQQDLYFFPLPHGQGSLRPVLATSRFCGTRLMRLSNQ